MIIDYHSFFFFLGTTLGELFKKTFELVLFTLITYMLASEFMRSKRPALKYLIFSFSIFSLNKLLATVILLGLNFGNIGPTTYYYYYPIIDLTLDVFALILLSNAFLYPIYKNRRRLNNSIALQTITLVILSTFFSISAIIDIIGGGKAADVVYYSSMIFYLMKFVLVIYPIYILHKNRDKKYRNREQVIIGFMLYSVTPLLLFLNLFLFGGNSLRMIVASHPFPILAVLQFTRIIFLRLVNKAYLIKRLKISEKLYQKEKELSKMKDNFLSTVSHELRTPLTSIKLYNSLLRNKKLGKITKKQEDAMDIIGSETDRLSELINDVLDLSKLEAGKINFDVREFDLNLFLDKNPFYKLAEEKNLKLKNNVKGKFIMKADEDKIKRAIINLISNSIKYTEKGKIILYAEETKNYYQITVEDEGIGMTKEHQEKMFDKFFQVDHSMTRKDKGTGLGLAIVNEIMKLHKGKIKVDSEPGKGTKITLFIPKDL